MGGGGSYSNYTRNITENNNDDDCSKINFFTELQNIQPNISSYNAKDSLDVKLDNAERIYAEGEHGICGYITAINAVQLIKCLKMGKQFEAIILNVSPTYCHVQVTPN